MNLNDFVVLPNNKAKSVKLNARNLQELQMETVTLAQESKEMEEKLQQLKESMSKEKEERGQPGGFRWRSGQCGSLNTTALTNSTKKNKERALQKLSAGKVKIRVLKDEPLTAPPQPPLPPPPPAVNYLAARKNRLRGTKCGQCEVKTAGLKCAECSEDYCVGCFAKFHQKGALKLHKIIPIQTDLQTHVSTRDVVSCFQKQINPSSHPGIFTSANPSPNSKPSPNHTIKSDAITRREDQSTEKGTETVTKPMDLQHDPSQDLTANCEEKKKVEMIEDGLAREDGRGFHTTLLSGEYDEEESARSFQEAVRQWRRETNDAVLGSMSEDAMWTPVRPVSVSAMATQADLYPDRGGGEGRVPVRVEFTENGLTYMERLLLKKHRRTPVVICPFLAFGTDYKNSLPNSNTQEETTSSLTAREEDFRRYCASLFAVPVSRGRAEPQITTPVSCLTIEVLDESDKDINGDFVAEHRTENKTEVPSVQQVLKGRTLVPQTGSVPSSCSSPSPTQPSRQSRPTAVPKLHISNQTQTSQTEHSMKSSYFRSKPSACPTASKTPRTSKTSVKTPNSTSQKSNCSSTVHKSKPDCGSQQHSSSLPKSSHAPNVSALASAIPPIPSPSAESSLRSTFTISPLSSTESTLLPQVYQSTSFQKGSDSSLLPEQPQSSKLFPVPISSFRLSQIPTSNLDSSRRSQHSLCDPESRLPDNQLQVPPSPVSFSPNLVEPNLAVESLRGFHNGSPRDAYCIQSSTPKKVFMSPTPFYGDHESTLTLQDANCILPPSSRLLNFIQHPSLAVTKEKEEELSTDSGDEMSSDSLGLGPHEEDSSDSSDEEIQMHKHLTRWRSRGEEQGHPAISHLEDSFAPAFAEGERDLQNEEQEQLSEPCVVMHRQSAGSGSEHFYDMDGFQPLGLDINFGHSDTPEHTHCNTSPSLLCGSDPTESEDFCQNSNISSYAEEHLDFRMMTDSHTQPYGIQIQSTTPTSRGETSANELGTSGSTSNQSGKSTPTQSLVPAACHLLRPKLGSELNSVSRPFSRAAQEIMEICSVDQTGCEDPDLDTDTTTHTLQELEQELRRGSQASVFGAGSSGSQDQHGNNHFMRGRVSDEQKDEELAAQTDQQSVLLLP